MLFQITFAQLLIIHFRASPCGVLAMIKKKNVVNWHMRPGLGAECPFFWVAVPGAQVVGGEQNERSDSVVSRSGN